MKNLWSTLFCFVLLFAACGETSSPPQETAEQSPSPKKSIPNNEALAANNPGALLVKEMIDALGGLEAYYQLQDVEYTYTYQDDSQERQDISTERYLYDGELSWAKYNQHSHSVMPDKEGVIIQGFDGKAAWVSHNDTLLEDEKAIGMANFLRKTNFYWFNMMFKLLDPGTRFEQKTNREVNGIDYQVVEVSFGENIGDAQDTYLLYLNPETKLVDQFLFTVMAFGRAEPLLMEVKYEKVDGLSWPTYRRYTPTNWEGQVAEDASWTEEISKDLKFNNGFKAEEFTKPALM
ncbi:MAG: DUF6503 family protein [Bacteroidota bacterium]